MQQFNTLQAGDKFICQLTGSQRKVFAKFPDYMVEQKDCGWLVRITPSMIGWNKIVEKI